MEIIVNNMALITINETLFVQLLSFLIFLFIINRVMFRPLRRTMNERDTYIQEIQSSIRQAEDETAAILDEINAQESAARSEASALAKEIEDAGSDESVKILSDTREEIKKRLLENRELVEDQITHALQDIRNQATDLADAMIGKLTDKG